MEDFESEIKESASELSNGVKLYKIEFGLLESYAKTDVAFILQEANKIHFKKRILKESILIISCFLVIPLIFLIQKFLNQEVDPKAYMSSKKDYVIIIFIILISLWRIYSLFRQGRIYDKDSTIFEKK
jgi:hypothetical protein